MVFWMLLLLGLLPVLAFLVARKQWPRRLGLVTAVAVGAVISPFTMALYGVGMTIIPIGFPLVLIGGFVAIIHGSPGFWLAIVTGVIVRGRVVEGVQHLYTFMLGVVVWVPAYALVGLAIDQLRLRRMSQPPGMSSTA